MERDKNPYTLLIHGKQLTKKERFIRIDTDNLDDGICHVIGEYAKAIWGNDTTKIPAP